MERDEEQVARNLPHPAAQSSQLTSKFATKKGESCRIAPGSSVANYPGMASAGTGRSQSANIPLLSNLLRVASARAFDGGFAQRRTWIVLSMMGNFPSQYDGRLVGLSVVIAGLASYCALDLASRVTAASGRARAIWLAGGAVAMGIGIWSMHYVGMLAFELPVPVLYHLPTALASLLAAILASAVALWVVSRREMRLGQAVRGSIVMGLGMAAMHYSGMASMRLPATISYQPLLVLGSVVVAVTVSLMALGCAFQLREPCSAVWSWRKLGGAVLLGAAIPGMHYTGMMAIRFDFSRAATTATQGVAMSCLATTIIVVSTFAILGLALSTALLDRRYSADTAALQAATNHYQQFLRQVIDANPHIIFVKDWDGKYVLANTATAEFYGTTVESLLGKRDADFNRQADEVERFLREDRDVMAMERPALIQEQQATNARTGERRWFQVGKVPLLSSDGTRQVLGVATDITERKQLEDQFRQAHKMEAVGRLAGGVAHDFNNVLTIIRAQTEFLLADIPADSAHRADVLEIQNAADRATAFTRQLLAFSRRQLLQPEILDLNGIITGMEMMVRRLVGEDTVVLTKLHPELPRIWADPAQLQQVLLNLAVNSRDAMPGGGTLLVETTVVELDEYYPRQHPSAKSGVHVVLAVTDTGCGMDAVTRARIFEPFFTTKEPGKGTGLGLSTVYGIVKQSDGHIWVYSEPGRGTTFKLYFPPHHGAVQATQPERSLAPALDHGATILLVEDERPVRSTVRRLLERHGYDVLEAANGQDALKLISDRGTEIDLVLSDMVMPGMGGMELADRVRGLSLKLPVLLMTGYTEEALTRAGSRPHNEQILEKPFTLHTMLEKVRYALASSQA
jgi:PAS domain S-box-containing protein